MTTVQDLLQQRSSKLRELTDQIDQEITNDGNLERLAELADELGAEGDSFAETITKARAMLGGEEDGSETQDEG